jgi:hypothetical protein
MPNDSKPVYVLACDGQGQNWLTWYQLENICEMLRKHKQVEIRCDGDSGPYISNLVTELTVVKEKK